MGYNRLIMALKKSFLICLLQTAVIAIIFALSKITELSVLMLLAPILNFFVAYSLSKKYYRYKTLLFSLITPLLLFILFLTFMFIQDSFLDISLTVSIFLCGFIISDLLCLLVIFIERKIKHRKWPKNYFCQLLYIWRLIRVWKKLILKKSVFITFCLS